LGMLEVIQESARELEADGDRVGYWISLCMLGSHGMCMSHIIPQFQIGYPPITADRHAIARMAGGARVQHVNKLT
jgi:hypothetical protein